jgi:hypothetical protein
MNARPSIFLPASEEALLIVSRWQRQSLEVAMAKLIQDAPEAGEEIEDDSTSLPPLAALDDEYAAAADLGREE